MTARTQIRTPTTSKNGSESELAQGVRPNVFTKGHDEPPEPIVVVRGQVRGMLHDEGPLGEGEAEARQGPVAARHGVAGAHQEEKSDPVEQESN